MKKLLFALTVILFAACEKNAGMPDSFISYQLDTSVVIFKSGCSVFKENAPGTDLYLLRGQTSASNSINALIATDSLKTGLYMLPDSTGLGEMIIVYQGESYFAYKSSITLTVTSYGENLVSGTFKGTVYKADINNPDLNQGKPIQGAFKNVPINY